MADETELSLSKVKEICGGNLDELTKLNASKRNIVRVCDLRSFAYLERLDLSQNALTSLKGIRHCNNLKWLNISNNKLDSLTDIKGLQELVVLNAGHNCLTSTIGLLKITKLKALILNNNQIPFVEETDNLTNLNALVLSHNKFKVLNVDNMVGLTKLSLSHNQLKEIPSVKKNKKLKELRLNDNKIKSVPDEIRFTTWLVLTDLGNNRIKEFRHVEPLSKLTYLKNLNLRGNPLCSMDGYKAKIIQVVPSLDVLDGKKLDYLEKYEKKSAKTKLDKEDGDDDYREPKERNEPKKTALETQSKGGVDSGTESETSKSKPEKNKKKKQKKSKRLKDLEKHVKLETGTLEVQAQEEVSRKKKGHLHSDEKDVHFDSFSKTSDKVGRKNEDDGYQTLSDRTHSEIKQKKSGKNQNMKDQKRNKRKFPHEATQEEESSVGLDGESPRRLKKKKRKMNESESERGQPALGNPRSAVVTIKSYKKRRDQKETKNTSEVNTVLASLGASEIGTGLENAW